MAAGSRCSRDHSPLQGGRASPPNSKRDTLAQLAEELATANKQARDAPRTPAQEDVLRLALLSNSSGWRPGTQGSLVVSPVPGSGIARVDVDTTPWAPSRDSTPRGSKAPPGQRLLPDALRRQPAADGREPAEPREAPPLGGLPRWQLPAGDRRLAEPREAPPPGGATPRLPAAAGACAAAADAAAAPPQAAPAAPRAPPRLGAQRYPLGEARAPPPAAPRAPAGGAEPRTPPLAAAAERGASPARAPGGGTPGSIGVPPPPQAAARLGAHARAREPADELLRARQAHDRQLGEVRLQLDTEQRRCRDLQGEHAELLREVQAARRLAGEVENLQARARERELESARQENAAARYSEEARSAGRRVEALREERADLEERLHQGRAEALAEEELLRAQVQAAVRAHELLELSAEQERAECAAIERDARRQRAALLLAEADAQGQREAEAGAEEQLRLERGAAARWRGEACALAELEQRSASAAPLRVEEELAHARAALEERDEQIAEQRRENARLAAAARGGASLESSDADALSEATRRSQELLGAAREELCSLKVHVHSLSRHPSAQRPGQEMRSTPHFALSPTDSPAGSAGGESTPPLPPTLAADESSARLRAEFAERLAAVLREGDDALGALRAEAAELRRENRRLQAAAAGAAEARPGPPPWERLWEEMMEPLWRACRSEAQARDEAGRRAAQCLLEVGSLEEDVACVRSEASAYEAQAAAARAAVEALVADAPAHGPRP